MTPKRRAADLRVGERVRVNVAASPLREPMYGWHTVTELISLEGMFGSADALMVVSVDPFGIEHRHCVTENCPVTVAR